MSGVSGPRATEDVRQSQVAVLLQLHGRDLRPLTRARSGVPFIAQICTSVESAESRRGKQLLLLERAVDRLPSGFRGYLLRHAVDPGEHSDVYLIDQAFPYLDDGDIVRVEPERCALAVLYRARSAYNSMLVTERCDNYCIMCSQPPKQRADGWLVDELFEMIPLMAPDTPELGITGGEPALLGGQLPALVRCLATTLPQTAVHVLSNGRAFADEAFARALAAAQHPDLMLGIPLYGALPEHHDYIVQRRGAFDETIRGILNLKRHGVRVELRFVIHAETHAWLPPFARFVARNLVFVDHVALMGLELMGFARSNLDALWIDPIDYQHELVEAASILERARMFVSIYNHQLCVLDPRVHHLARRAISDWKNRYFEECDNCSVRTACGGFFASNSHRRSRGIAAVPDTQASKLQGAGTMAFGKEKIKSLRTAILAVLGSAAGSGLLAADAAAKVLAPRNEDEVGAPLLLAPPHVDVHQRETVHNWMNLHHLPRR
ncbi:His-Xaa-Ser system radical SAM maturase HxsC [Candidatus Gracilibacteria bacterium]|nr:His-Xaa-Ser system radical SAM maturase HxsC [Candidatus Gracilibacteria bacterium]